MNNVSNSQSVIKDNDLTIKYSKSSYLKFFILSAVGVFMFFITININGVKSIPIDHLVSLIRKIPFVEPYYGIIITMIGGVFPFINKSWNKNKTEIVFSFIKLLAIPFVIMAYFKLGPADFHKPNMLPFSYRLLTQVAVLIPIGAVCLSFLIDYGLMAFVGIFMRYIMRPIWKTPGMSSIDALASFIGSYSVGLLITNKVYKDGYYSAKEACIIATGFSTVSTTFMVVVAKTLGIIDKWNIYFWGTLAITFIVTAITVRLYPLRSKSDKGYLNRDVIEEPKFTGGNIFSKALYEGVKAADKSNNFLDNILKNLKEGLLISISIMPNFMAITFIGLLIVNYTPLFDFVSYIFLPFTKLLGLGDEAYTVAKACSITIVEMFSSSSIIMDSSKLAKSVIAIVCVSEILYFAAPIPCMLAADIPIRIRDIIVIWIERIIFSLILAVPFAYFFLI